MTGKPPKCSWKGSNRAGNSLFRGDLSRGAPGHRVQVIRVINRSASLKPYPLPSGSCRGAKYPSAPESKEVFSFSACLGSPLFMRTHACLVLPLCLSRSLAGFGARGVP